jgi:hypothetical protein
LSALPRQTGPRRLRSLWPSSPARSGLRIRSGHPAGERPVPAVVWRFEEYRLPELVVAAGARDPDVSHAAAAPGRLPGRLAEAQRPAHLRLAGPQLVTVRAGFRLVIEQRSEHLNDHARTGCHASMIIVTCTDDRADRAPGDRARGPGGPMPSRLAPVNLAQSSGKPTLAIAFHRRCHWSRRLRPTGNRAAGGEGAVRGSSPASVGPASEGTRAKLM